MEMSFITRDSLIFRILLLLFLLLGSKAAKADSFYQIVNGKRYLCTEQAPLPGPGCSYINGRVYCGANFEYINGSVHCSSGGAASPALPARPATPSRGG